MASYDVVVAGAGLGGLCAAAGLCRAGLRVLVLERNAGLLDRRQGYRININLAGDGALRACLPEAHFALYRDTAHRQVDPSVDVFSTDLTHLLHRTAELSPGGVAPSAVDRATLRAILLDAVEEVHFGREVVNVSARADGAEVHVSGGARVWTEVLVAADGAHSTLRRRLLPGRDPVPLGIVGIYGRAPLEPGALTWLPRGVVDQRFVGVTNGAGTTLALGTWYPRRAPAEAVLERVPGLELPAIHPYVMWVLLAPDDAAPGSDAAPDLLHRFALSAVRGWDEAATRFVRDAIVLDTIRVRLCAMTAVPWWPTGRVTFLGDAVHAMSPAGGEGANTALADAASLVSCLEAHGPKGLAEYEGGLRERARAALDRSARYGQGAPPIVPTHA